MLSLKQMYGQGEPLYMHSLILNLGEELIFGNLWHFGQQRAMYPLFFKQYFEICYPLTQDGA